MLTLQIVSRTEINPLWLLAGLVVLLLSYPVSNWLMAEPQPDSANSDFSATAALERLQYLVGDGEPRPIGSEANRAARERLVTEFGQLGYEVELQETLACREEWATCGFVANVIARQPGTRGTPAVLMTAHHDSVGAGPGVADDLAGVAALLEVASLERDADRANPLMFVITDGEEVGLLGAEAFTRHEAFADVAAVVNVEARGTSGQSLLFETSPDNAWLLEAFAAEANLPAANSLYYELYRLLPNDTDFSVYLEAGLPGLNFAAVGDSRYYHTPLDNLDNLSPGTLQHHGDNLLAAARGLGNADLSLQPAGDAIYMNTLPGRMFRLPVGWAFYVSIAGLVLWFVAAARLISTGQLSGLGLFLGVAMSLAALLLAGTFGQLVSFVLPSLFGGPAPWWSDPLPALFSILALVLFVMLLSGLISAAQSGYWGLALGGWFWFGLIGFLLLEFLPGASVVFLVPATAFAAVQGLLALSPVRGNSAAAGLSGLIVLGVSAAVWLQLALAVAEVLGLEAGAVIGLCAGFAALGLLPLTAVRPGLRRLPAGLTLLSLLGAAFGVYMAVQVAPFTEESPQFMDILHFEQAEEGVSQEARWLLDTVPAAPVPAELLDAMAMSSWQEPALPWTGWAFHSAAAEAEALEFPTVTRIPAEHGGVRLRLESPRAGDQLHLFVPQQAEMQRLLVEDGAYVIDYSDWPPGLFRQLTCHSVACSGLEVELLLSGSEPFSVLVVDQSAGLPAGGMEFMALRNGLAVPWQDGDVTLRANRVLVEPN